MTVLGLLLITLGWVIQYIHIQKSQTINRMFVLSYASGVGFLILDTVLQQLDLTVAINLASLVLALLVMMKVKKPGV